MVEKGENTPPGSDGMKVLGMEFAPMKLPLQRRLQTFAVLYWISSILFQGVLVTILLLYMFFYTSYWWITVMYGTWFVYDLDTCNR